ncbi:MAG: TraR/DksA C4-type zinc finger protein [Candidatus Eisenbacteria bacterium]|nr:TraR/DksA C4-type zinc finger protein [Candidatus Eisenbacteria bacterium]
MGKSHPGGVRRPESTRGNSLASGTAASKATSGAKPARPAQGELPSAQPRQDRLPQTHHGRGERESFTRASAEARDDDSHFGRDARRSEPRKGDLRPREVKAQPLSKKDLEFFTGLLRSELTRLATDLGKLENSVLKRTQRDASGDLSAYSIHMADLGTDAMEREKDLHLASAEGKRVGEILEALRKVERGVFGECERCGGPIGRKRLEAVPHAPFCLPCQERMERRS